MSYQGPSILQSGTDVVTAFAIGSVVLSDVVAGSRLVAIEVSSSSDPSSVVGVTDSQGNTWEKHRTVTQSNRTTSIWTAVAGMAGACTVTAEFSAAASWVFLVAEVEQCVVVDGGVDQESTSVTTHYSADTGITGEPHTLIVAACSLNAVTSSWTAAAGFSLLYSGTGVLHAVAIQAGEFIFAPFEVRAPFTSGTARASASAMITLAAAGVGGGGTFKGFQNRRVNQATGFRVK